MNIKILFVFSSYEFIPVYCFPIIVKPVAIFVNKHIRIFTQSEYMWLLVHNHRSFSGKLP